MQLDLEFDFLISTKKLANGFSMWISKIYEKTGKWLQYLNFRNLPKTRQMASVCEHLHTYIYMFASPRGSGRSTPGSDIKGLGTYLNYRIYCYIHKLSTQLGWPFTTSLNHNITIWWGFFRQLPPMRTGMAWQLVLSAWKNHHIVILQFSEVVKGHAKYIWNSNISCISHSTYLLYF